MIMTLQTSSLSMAIKNCLQPKIPVMVQIVEHTITELSQTFQKDLKTSNLVTIALNYTK